MKINERKDKNDLFFQDININNKNFTFKMFFYFYSLFQNKKENNSFLTCSLMIIETIQFISFAFTPLHYDSWKLDIQTVKIISYITGGFRLSVLIKFIDYKIYCIILYFLIIIIFIFCLTVILQILFGDSSSKIYRFSNKIIQNMIEFLPIILYFPITEIILIPIKCVNGKVVDVINGETCWESMHYLNSSLGIISTILVFFSCIFMLNFDFYPFQNNMSSFRINSNNDIIIILMKLFIILQNLLITNEYISLSILLLASIFMFYECFSESTYNNKTLESFITSKNLLVIWVYFVLLITKVFKNSAINGFIYLLLFGCPIIIYLSNIISNENNSKYIHLSENTIKLNDYIKKEKFNIKLIDSFFELNNNNLRNEKESETQRNIILLLGNIKVHTDFCDDKDCPLTKFIKNEGNFNIQKQCLLNYMNIFFNKGIKKFPNNVYLLIIYIHFNFSKKFNLNSVKTNLNLLKKIKCTIKEKYIIFCLEQNIKNSNSLNLNINNEQENDNQIDVTVQQYQKLKYLIENSIKLYAEFWGIFSITITNNINTNKLYLLGEKLNKYLYEINNLWDELKNKKIGNDCHSIVQLYSKFLLEILLDKNKSKEVYKKLNDESLNNFYQKDNNKLKHNSGEGKNDQLVDNQDYLFFCDSDERGNCKIIQSSASFSHLLGYQKYDIIGKPVDIIYPNILIEKFNKYIAESINILHMENNQKDLSIQENNVNKNLKQIMVKNRIGYIIPLFAYFTVSDDNDYSDSFLIKAKLEYKESRAEYAYYVLTNTDFIIENISSSALNLGLSLDLIRKYDAKIDILIRTNDNKYLNIYEKYKEFEEESKIVVWIFPDIIYPKDDSKIINKEKDEEIEILIKKSEKKKFNLQIKEIKLNENDIIGFAFKFTEISLRKKNKVLKNELFIPSSNKKVIMFHLLNLSYIRTLIVEEKSGSNNLIELENNIEKEEFGNSVRTNKNKNDEKVKKKIIYEEGDSDDSDKNINQILLTREKILELQVHNFLDIKNFIFSLPIYGSDVALERFRPNGDKYSASKISEALIKIKVSNFCKTLEEKYHIEQNLKKKKNKNANISNNNLNSPNSYNINNSLISTDQTISSSNSTTNIINGEDMNKGLASDSSSTLSNIFKADSIKYIAILVFFIFIEIILFVSIEFIIMNNNINKLSKKIEILHKGYIILNDMLYTKYFVTEGVLGNNLNMNYLPVMIKRDLNTFLLNIKGELAFLRQEFTETYNTFTSNEICNEYKEYISQTIINIYTLTVNKTEYISLLFNSAINRIPSSINGLVSDPSLMNMENRDTFELMYALLNEYYIKWKKVILILLNDSEKGTKPSIPLLIIMICFLIVSFIIFVIFLKLLSKFSIDREKPINLFFTMKKIVFENLKNSAENFSNKLLNKLFGNEENEEESQKDFQINIKSNDINIVKLKAINDFDSSIKNAFSFIEIVFVIFLFLLFNIVCSIIKYFNFNNRMNNISQFITLFDKINIDQSDFILSINIFKSYLYNNLIPILNKNNTNDDFIESFMNLSEDLEDLIICYSKTDSFLKGKFIEKFEQYLFGNIIELLDNEFVERNRIILNGTFSKGLKSCKTKMFENIRYMTVKYCNSTEIYNNREGKISKILEEREFAFHEMNMGIQHVVKPWYSNVIKLMINTFYDFKNKSSIIYIVFFICLIVFDILFYTIIWRTYEEKLKVLLKGSIDLINLIPQEIKNIIIEKLNE